MKTCSLKRNAVILAVTITSFLSTVSTTPAPSLSSGSVGPGSSRTFTVVNHCPFTIWCGRKPRGYGESTDTPCRPALFTDLNAGKSVPSQPTGWEQASGATVTFTVPYNWTAGRIWGRTECNFANPGPTSCATGGCNGGLLCDPSTGTARTSTLFELSVMADGGVLQGVPPVSVAEWTLGVNGVPDYYDVSLVDGSNLPMTITSDKGCPSASCPVDLNPECKPNINSPRYGFLMYVRIYRPVRIGFQRLERHSRRVQECMLRESERQFRYTAFGPLCDMPSTD